MSILNAPANVSFTSGQSVPDHFKAFINYWNKQAALHADKVYIRYYINGQLKTLTYKDMDQMAINLACSWANDLQGVEVVSYFGDHNLSYLVVLLAILKLRITMLAISPRNSEAATLNLLEKTGSKLLIANVKYERFAKSVIANNTTDASLLTISTFDVDALSKAPLTTNYEQILNMDFTEQDISKPALIIHSSGSTAFPKPLYLSNRYLFHVIDNLELSINANSKLEPLTDRDVILPSTPLFHIFGLWSYFSVTIHGGSAIMFEQLPISPTEISNALSACNITIMAAPPLIYEQLAAHLEETDDLRAVQRIKYALFGGAGLKLEILAWYHAHRINLCTLYGITETGITMSSDVDPDRKNRSSLRFIHKDEKGQSYGTFETNDESEPHVKHLYIHANSPTLANHVANRPDGGYSTQDLFIEDRDFPGTYTYYGRRDDILIMENGEKTNPVPMEATIRQHPMVQQVAVIGHQRQCTAALIQLNREHAECFGPEEIIAIIHAAVKEANIECPNHSKIFPQMVKILPFNQILPSTDKGTIMRKKAESAYQDVVEKLYKDFLQGGTSHTKANTEQDVSVWTPEQTDDFLITCAAEVMDVPPSTFEDRTRSIFDMGFNSLSAIQLQNRIAEYFRSTTQSFLYQHPSIISMREALMSDQQEDASEKHYQRTQTLAEAYLKRAKEDFPRASNQYDESRPKVVLLTGATGSVGSFILRSLLQDPTVVKVYCCVRGEEDQLKDRLAEAVTSRSLDASMLETGRVEVLPMRFDEPWLGFSEERYHQLKKEVTIVQHCAWLLNFNLQIDHFDKECIQPFYNFLKFAYNEINPMHVHFVSSVSASALWGSAIAEEPLPLDSKCALPIGYAASKFIVEILLNYLTAEKNFPCYIERLGQVCGDSVNGVWNTSEQYPLLFIGGGSIMKMMPRLNTEIDWIPCDFAAASIADIMIKTSHLPANTNESIYHIVNPQPIQWHDVLTAMKESGMEFDIVDPSKWVKELAKDDTNPAYRLISFYQEMFNDSFRMSEWKTERTRALTPIISQSSVLDADLFSRYLNYWKSVGFYNPLH